MVETKKSDVYNIIKFISMLLVVLAHSTRMYTEKGVFHPVNDSMVLASVTDYIYVFHMPLFILVSGAVFGLCIEKGKYTNIPDFLINKAKRLLIPYLFFGIAYVAPVMCLLSITNQSFFEYCLKGILLSSDSRHLWYVLALFLIFVMAIIIRPLLVKSRMTRFIVLACSLLLFVVSSKIPNLLQSSAACSYQLYFFIGLILHYEYGFVEKVFRKLFLVFVLTPFILAGMFWFNPNSISNLCYTFVGIIMVVFIGYCIDRWCKNFTGSFVFKIINKNSFGIFLFHPMIIYILYYFLGPIDINPYLLSIGIALISLVMSVGLTELMRMLRLKVLIGE
ncbi:MAG: acyltransferase [Ruminococcaceae bacterium]|nr:acyltransferase [Oscillospiraceae bacterium]